MTHDDPTTVSTRAVVERFYELAEANQPEAIAEILDPDVVNWEAESLPYAGSYRGREAVVGLLRVLFNGIELGTVKHIAILADGERAAAFLEVPFTFDNPDLPNVMPIIETFLVRNGLIVEIRPYYFDTAAIGAKRRK
jgi:uncharacterized protein